MRIARNRLTDKEDVKQSLKQSRAPETMVIGGDRVEGTVGSEALHVDFKRGGKLAPCRQFLAWRGPSIERHPCTHHGQPSAVDEVVQHRLRKVLQVRHL